MDVYRAEVFDGLISLHVGENVSAIDQLSKTL